MDRLYAGITLLRRSTHLISVDIPAILCEDKQKLDDLEIGCDPRLRPTRGRELQACYCHLRHILNNLNESTKPSCYEALRFSPCAWSSPDALECLCTAPYGISFAVLRKAGVEVHERWITV